MNPALAVALIQLIQVGLTEGPGAIKGIMDAWSKVDPTFEDFDALTMLAADRLAKKETPAP
jgi:hypothetical protein